MIQSIVSLNVANPLRYFNVNGEACPLECAYLAAGVAANQQVVAARSGKKIRIMGWKMQSSTGAVGAFTFISNSGGAQLHATLSPPPTTNGDSDFLPICETGYMETSTGHGLFVTVATAAVSVNVFFIAYTP